MPKKNSKGLPRLPRLPTLVPRSQLKRPSDKKVLEAARELNLHVNEYTGVQWINNDDNLPVGLTSKHYTAPAGSPEIHGAYDDGENVLYVLKFTE